MRHIPQKVVGNTYEIVLKQFVIDPRSGGSGFVSHTGEITKLHEDSKGRAMSLEVTEKSSGEELLIDCDFIGLMRRDSSLTKAAPALKLV